MTHAVANTLVGVKTKAEAAGVFGTIQLEDGRLSCAAAASAEPAFYRLEIDPDGTLAVALVTDNRWLSESIEADLMHHGDPIEELIEEELVELGFNGGRPVVKHYRSDDMLYTFRTPVPTDGLTGSDLETRATQFLLGYEAAFRELGDMESDADE